MHLQVLVQVPHSRVGNEGETSYEEAPRTFYFGGCLFSLAIYRDHCKGDFVLNGPLYTDFSKKSAEVTLTLLPLGKVVGDFCSPKGDLLFACKRSERHRFQKRLRLWWTDFTCLAWVRCLMSPSVLTRNLIFILLFVY